METALWSSETSTHLFLMRICKRLQELTTKTTESKFWFRTISLLQTTTLLRATDQLGWWLSKLEIIESLMICVSTSTKETLCRTPGAWGGTSNLTILFTQSTQRTNQFISKLKLYKDSSSMHQRKWCSMDVKSISSLFTIGKSPVESTTLTPRTSTSILTINSLSLMKKTSHSLCPVVNLPWTSWTSRQAGWVCWSRQQPQCSTSRLPASSWPMPTEITPCTSRPQELQKTTRLHRTGTSWNSSLTSWIPWEPTVDSLFSHLMRVSSSTTRSRSWRISLEKKRQEDEFATREN